MVEAPVEVEHVSARGGLITGWGAQHLKHAKRNKDLRNLQKKKINKNKKNQMMEDMATRDHAADVTHLTY